MIEFEQRNQYDSFWKVLKSETLKLFQMLIGQYELSDMKRLDLWDSNLNIYNNDYPDLREMILIWLLLLSSKAEMI